MTSSITSADVTLPSSLIRTHASILLPSLYLGSTLGIRSLQVAVSPCWGEGPSRCYLCESFPACLDPYPGCSCGAHTRFFPQNYGLPGRLSRSALGDIHTIATSAWRILRGCSHSLMFRPTVLLATQVASTAVLSSTEQPWRLHPSISQFVTSLCPRYANRPIRATDGKGTCTPQNSQPYRLLQEIRCAQLSDSRTLLTFI